MIEQGHFLPFYSVHTYLPKASEHPREPHGKRFSRCSNKSNFRQKATNFCLELAI